MSCPNDWPDSSRCRWGTAAPMRNAVNKIAVSTAADAPRVAGALNDYEVDGVGRRSSPDGPYATMVAAESRRGR